MFSFPFQLSFNQMQNSIFGEKYKEYLQTDSIIFFQLLMVTLCFNGFMALLVFTIQQQGTGLMAFMAAISVINFISIFQSQRLKPYLQHVFAQLYVFYIAAVLFVILYGVNVPLFIQGYGTGIVFCGIIQFCNIKVKVLFVIATPWVFFAFTNIFSFSFLHYIAFTLSSCSLLGLLTYQFEAKQRHIYSQSIIIKKQQEIIKEFTNDSLCCISYDERQRQFKLEFSNSQFDSNYTEDIKELLRSFQIIPDLDITANQRKNIKSETLEEYLYQYNQIEKDYEGNSYFSLKIRHKEHQKVQDINVLRTYFFQSIFVIAIKSSLVDSQVEKYENKQKKLKESIISLSSDTGVQLQSLYRSLNSLMESACKSKYEICKFQQSNILRMLNRMKNYLIYFQSNKAQLLNTSIKSYDLICFVFFNQKGRKFYFQLYQLQMFQQAILGYFEIQSALKNRLFLNSSQINFNENQLLRNNQNLLTQILVNVFNIILIYSLEGSTIRFSVSFDENSNSKQCRPTQRSYTSNRLLNSQELPSNLILQFKFTFQSDKEIENLQHLLCQRQDDFLIETEQVIASSVNQLILRMIGPYNEICTKIYQTSNYDKYFHEVSFCVYTDQTQLDPSYIKQIELQKAQ